MTWREPFPLPRNSIVARLDPKTKTIYFERHEDGGVYAAEMPETFVMPEGYRVVPKP